MNINKDYKYRVCLDSSKKIEEISGLIKNERINIQEINEVNLANSLGADILDELNIFINGMTSDIEFVYRELLELKTDLRLLSQTIINK